MVSSDDGPSRGHRQQPKDRHWFEPVADHLGEAYLRYSFTRGTVGEVDALLTHSGIGPGARVLDVGCGPGRHALELASRGYEVVGVDISATFVALAETAAARRGLTGATFAVADARSLSFWQEFDLVISLCQGAFGLTGGPAAGSPVGFELDEPVLAGMAAAAKPGGTVIVSAFSAYFQMRFAEDDRTRIETFDAALGVNEEETVIRSPGGEERPTRLWTTCYTPRELRLLARIVGLTPIDVHGVTPGRYGAAPPTTDCPEFLLVAGAGPAEERGRDRTGTGT